MHGSPQLAPLRVLQRAFFLPLSLSYSWFVAAVDCKTDRACRASLRTKTDQTEILFMPDDTVNMGKVRRLCTIYVLFHPGC